MTDNAITEKINCIVETDGLLRDYLNSVVIRDIKARIDDNRFNRKQQPDSGRFIAQSDRPLLTQGVCSSHASIKIRGIGTG